jgi:hypothetical protein
VSPLFMVMAFWLGGNVVLATAVWSRYRRRCNQEQSDVSVVPTHLMPGIDRDGGESKLSPQRQEEHRRPHEGDVAVIS